MTTKTRVQLKNQALTNLNIIGVGQEAEDDEMQVVEDLVDPLIEDLNARGIVYVSDADAIDNSVFMPLAELLANEAAPAFGQPKNPAKQEVCEERLRVVTRRAPPARMLLQTDTALRTHGMFTLAQWRRGDF